MSQYDLLVRNGTVVTPGDESRADLAIAPNLAGTSAEENNTV